MRARYPDVAGAIDRDGVLIAYEVFGTGDPTIVFIPPDPIVHGLMWKAQVPYLARHHRVVVIDPRGNGRSGQPTDPAAYADTEFVADTLAVMDALDIGSAFWVSICSSAWFGALGAATHPDRVLGLVAIAPWLPHFSAPVPHRAAFDFDAELDTTEGWAKDNRHYWKRDYLGYLEFFFGQLVPEPHSSKQREDCVSYGLDSTVDAQLAAVDGPLSVGERDECLAVLAKIKCPVLVIHGDDDRCQPASRAVGLAEATGGELLTMHGAGHLPHGREPVTVNLAIRDFVRRAAPPQARKRAWSRPTNHPPRALYLSSPIGLGHGRRDLAIADELRKLHPDLEIDWLAQHPVTAMLSARGERVHPASQFLASESAHVEAESGEHDLNAFQAIRTMDEILVANFMVFTEVIEQERYDLWIGDEAWELDHFLHENPELKSTPYAWLTDFVGWMPMGTDDREAALTADYNAEMLDQIARLPRVRDRAIFVGNPDDVVDQSFGPGLPGMRSWTNAHYDFAGYVTGFDPAEVSDREALRAEFGFQPGEPVCVVAVGGSGVGAHLLRRVVDAYPAAARRVPGLRLVIVTGPRIDPTSISAPAGVEVHGFLPDLHRRFAASDLAVVQGGLTTTMELTASRRPFIYIPLRNHFEQNIHVRHRLDNYRAGTCLQWDEADPDHLAETIATTIGRTVDYRPVESDGAARVAELMAALI